MIATRGTEGAWFRDGGVPCRDCGTRGGYGTAEARVPGRVRGLCANCYKHHERQGTLDRYPTLETFVVRASVRRRSVSERRAEREAEIAARVARHEAASPLLPDDPEQVAKRLAGATAGAAAWLAAHPWQACGWDYLRLAAFGIGGEREVRR